MAIALWVIAVCEVIRILQNVFTIVGMRHDVSSRDNVYAEFIKSLHVSDKEFVRNMLEEFEKNDRSESNGNT